MVHSRIYLSVVIPAYNEENRLPSTLTETIAFLKRQKYSSEIVVVSDGSIDKTKEIAERFQETFPELKVIEYFPNRGKGAAVKLGMKESRGDYRLFMDADMAVPVEFATKLIEIIVTRYDIVIGSRESKNSKVLKHQFFFREFLGRLFSIVQRIVLGIPIRDTQCGFKIFERRVAEQLFPQVRFDCAYFDAELLFLAHKMGLSIAEVGVSWSHDGQTRLPIGIKRTIEIIKKLFLIRYYHRING